MVFFQELVRPRAAHTGELSTDSPALFAKLAPLLSQDALAQISQRYRALTEAFGFESAIVPRQEGVNFNPRPCRVLAILLEGRSALSVEEVFICWECCFADTVRPAASEPRRSELSEALLLRQKLRDGRLNELPSSLIQLALAVLLDDVRHLHVSTLPVVEQKMRLTQAEQAARSVKPSAPVHRLLAKLIHAIELQHARLP